MKAANPPPGVIAAMTPLHRLDPNWADFGFCGLGDGVVARTRQDAKLRFGFCFGGSGNGFFVVDVGIDEGNSGSLGGVGESLGDEVPAFGEPFADDEGVFVGPDRVDDDPMEFHFHGFNENDFIGAAEGFAGNDEDVFNGFAFEGGANRLSDPERSGGFGIQAEGIIDAGDDEEFAGFFVEDSLGSYDRPLPGLRVFLSQGIGEGDGDGRVVGVVGENDMREFTGGERDTDFGEVG